MMTDRLSQIWQDFSGRSSLDLSGTSIESTPRPSRHETDVPQVTFDAPIQIQKDTDTGIDPVNAALSAMHTRMAETAKSRHAKQAAPAELSSLRQLPETQLDKALFADVAFTRSKTDRDGGDYLSYAAERQLAWHKRKKKWFFGLF